MRRKWPRKLVARCISMPSFERVWVGRPITPALLIRMSMCGVFWRIDFTACRTEARSLRSRWMVRIVIEGKEAWTVSATDWALEMLRAVRRRVEGCWEARARTIASPSPLGLIPVIRTGFVRLQRTKYMTFW